MKNINLGMPCLVFVDGKDWLIAPKGNDTTIDKCTYSSKTEKTSARSLTFSIAAGFITYHYDLPRFHKIVMLEAIRDVAVSNIIYRIATKLSHPRKLRVQRKNAQLL